MQVVQHRLAFLVQTVGVTNPDIYYTDIQGNRNMEYLSCGVDYKPIFPPGRTAVAMYSDFIREFAEHYADLFDSLIYEVKIGLGPAGELRYPSYSSDSWNFPGIGEFQCYDANLLKEYNTAATKNNQWPNLPNNAGSYNDTPSDAPFFSQNTNLTYQSAYGQFFLEWYSSRLIQHGQSILGNAVAILNIYSPNVTVAAKLGCVYWQYKDDSHAAELTAGYKNDLDDGYRPFAQMLAGLGVSLEFSCFEKRDKDQTGRSAPEDLVDQTLQTAQSVGASLVGQNSQTLYNSSAFKQIEHNCRHDLLPIVGFDFHNLEDALFEQSNFDSFRSFVKTMANPGTIKR